MLERNPNVRGRYDKAIRRLVLETYDEIDRQGKQYFLDKTTRYYLILDFLERVFPRAKYVLLLRNPVAIATSILKTNFHGDICRFTQPDRRHDIMTAQFNLRRGAAKMKCLQVCRPLRRPSDRYEQFCS